MNPAVKAVLPLLLLGATAGCVPQDSVRHDSPVAVSWQKARTFLPGALWGVGNHPTGVFDDAALQEKMASIPGAGYVPAVVYMHGCGGLGGYINGVGQLLADWGYAVFAPNSFAAGDRTRQPDCAKTRMRLWHPERINRRRLAELNHAAQQVGTLPWIDRRNVYLMGASEGGAAVARYSGDTFRGHIIIASSCRSSAGGHYLGAPKSTPVLAVHAKHDRAYRTVAGGAVTCRVEGRPLSEVVILDTTTHYIGSFSQTIEAVRRFLRRTRI